MKMFLTIAAIAAALSAGACNPFESGFVAACETAIKERISGYTRLSLMEKIEPIEVDELFKAEPTIAAAYKRDGAKAVRHTARFTYQTGAATCTNDALEGSKATDSAFLVKVDGQTNLEWMVSRVAAVRR